ncbi:hypothetical protein [Pseudomonas extremaustralis]|uniref:hypothetical protein n=1 Tax=Pseudomonas extremaustralis TaxID=359110 RepID=UPI00285530CE|nr:hypothetical protein [Pseudomonas extremaustralis]MDR6580000.1 hypothetical protein [Pseudomonas extremaustralis]
MSEITRGAIGMPFEMAMESELSRRQFHSIAQALLAERDQLKAENETLRKDAERLQSATDFVQKLCDSAGNQPSVATGYLHDILAAMGKGGQS